jgi:hypothetical protein
MGYLPTHRFEPHPEDPAYCGVPDGEFPCTREPDHPIHATDRQDIEDLAAALAAKQWQTGGSRSTRSEHRRHNYSTDCALCMKDAHEIAAFVLKVLAR